MIQLVKSLLGVLKSALEIFGFFQRQAHDAEMQKQGASKLRQEITEDKIERMKRAEKHRSEHRDDGPSAILERMRNNAEGKGRS